MIVGPVISGEDTQVGTPLIICNTAPALPTAIVCQAEPSQYIMSPLLLPLGIELPPDGMACVDKSPSASATTILSPVPAKSVILAVPLTSNFADGEVVPIPTFPELL